MDKNGMVKDSGFLELLQLGCLVVFSGPLSPNFAPAGVFIKHVQVLRRQPSVPLTLSFVCREEFREVCFLKSPLEYVNTIILSGIAPDDPADACCCALAGVASEKPFLLSKCFSTSGNNRCLVTVNRYPANFPAAM